MWTPHGFHVDSTWFPHGHHVVSMWTQHYTWTLCVIQVDTTWSPCEYHVVSMLTLCSLQVNTAWFPHRPYIVSTWTPHGFHIHTTWFPYGHNMASQETTWKPAQKQLCIKPTGFLVSLMVHVKFRSTGSGAISSIVVITVSINSTVFSTSDLFGAGSVVCALSHCLSFSWWCW